MGVINDLAVYISNPDIVGIMEWLDDRNIFLSDCEVIDLSDPPSYRTVVIKLVFLNINDAVMFKMIWMGK
jgi:hypothetical protein